MPDVPDLVLMLYVAAMMAGLVGGHVRRRGLRERMERARTTAPVDAATGLWRASTFLVRAHAEMKRAERCGGHVQLTLWRVDGDPAGFGRAARPALGDADVGFRLERNLFGVLSTAIDEDPEAPFARVQRRFAELAGSRLAASATSRFPDEAGDLQQLTSLARQRLEAARAPRAGAPA